MPSPFPGMDPYLERPGIWPDIHHGIISEIQAQLHPVLRPRYVANVELRVYISDDDDVGRRVMIPDARIDRVNSKRKRQAPAAVRTQTAIAEPIPIKLLNEEIEEAYIEIRETKIDTLVTVIEVMSHTNKVAGAVGRTSLLAKRRDVMQSEVHWVEIDLLRAGKPTSLNDEFVNSDYRVVVSRSGPGRRDGFFGLSVRDPLPVIGIPLKPRDADVPLDLGKVLQSSYDRAGWDLKVDYTKAPVPPLRADDARWANKLLRSKGLR